VSTPFIDYETREYERHEEAGERRRHFRVVRDVMAGGQEAAEAEAVTLARDFADVTDGASLSITYLNMSPHLRCFVDAVIGATGGLDEFVELTDEVLAERLGRSTKSVQRYRDEFRAWKDHGAIIEIKDNWRHPSTHESHSHAYRCHITQLAVEAVLDARLSPQWSRNRNKAMEEAARTVAESAPCFPPRKPKKRRRVSDAETVARNLQQGAKLLKEAANLRPMVRNPNYDVLYELRRQLAEQLKAFDEAFGIESADVHVNTDIRRVDIRAASPSPEPSAESTRMEAKNEVERQVDTGQVDNLSTCNDSTESTTYENQEFSPPEFPPGSDDPETAREYQKLSEEYARDVKKAITDKVASGKTPESAYAEAEREIGEFEQWLDRRPAQYFDSICHRLKGSAPNATAAT
jgi:hypothetical protein